MAFSTRRDGGSVGVRRNGAQTTPRAKRRARAAPKNGAAKRPPSAKGPKPSPREAPKNGAVKRASGKTTNGKAPPAATEGGAARAKPRRAEAPALEFGEFASALRWIATASELELRDLFDHKPELRRSVDVLWRECKASTREGPGFDASALEMADDLLGGGFHGDEAGDAAVYLGGAGRDDATQDTQQSFGDEAGLDDSGGELFEPRDDDPRDAAARDDDDDDFRASAAADALLDDDGLEDATRDLIAQGTELLDSTRDLLEEPARDGGFDDTFGGGGAFEDGVLDGHGVLDDLGDLGGSAGGGADDDLDDPFLSPEADEEEDDLDDLLRKVNA
ncbi:hypothetical protein SO694_00105033 [Aureococcus anophagefferens]|uniref:Uncharacterized protein n=1 Tax=Aureococcus anophagefferens TaxID=44056 RepID=A0ABR1FMA5_AURAN